MTDVIGTMLGVLSDASAPGLDQLLDETIRTLAVEIAGPSGCVWLTDPRARDSCCYLAYDRDDIHFGTAAPPRFLNQQRTTLGQPWACEDVEQDASLVGQRSDLLERRIRSLLVVPLTTDDRLVASCVLGSREKQRYEPPEIRTACELAYPLALTMQLLQLQRDYFRAAMQEQRLQLQQSIDEAIGRIGGIGGHGSASPASAEPTVLAEPTQLVHPPPGGTPLTSREQQVLTLLAGGLTNRQIAITLNISEGTVRTHVSRVLRKLGVESRIQALKMTLEDTPGRPGATAKRG